MRTPVGRLGLGDEPDDYSLKKSCSKTTVMLFSHQTYRLIFRWYLIIG
jgi:hypothetical protein